MTGLCLSRRGAVRRRDAATPSSWSFTGEPATLLSEWTAVTDSAGQIALSTDPTSVHGGSKGIALTHVTTPTDAYLTKTGLGFPGSSSWSLDFWVKLSSSWALSETWRQLVLFTLTDDAGNLVRVFMTGARKFRPEHSIGGYATFGQDTGNITLNAWHKIGVRITGGGTASGTIAILQNDAPVATTPTLNMTSRWKPTGLILGPSGSTSLTHAGSMYFDDGLVAAA